MLKGSSDQIHPRSTRDAHMFTKKNQNTPEIKVACWPEKSPQLRHILDVIRYE